MNFDYNWKLNKCLCIHVCLYVFQSFSTIKMAEPSARAKTIIANPQLIRETSSGSISKGKEVRKSKAALEDKSTVLLRQPLPKYNFQSQTRKPSSKTETKYIQPVANVEPSPRGSSTENGGKLVYKVSPLKTGETIHTDGPKCEEKEALSLRMSPELGQTVDNSDTVKSGGTESEEINKLKMENTALKHQLDTQIASLTKQLDVQLQVMFFSLKRVRVLHKNFRKPYNID